MGLAILMQGRSLSSWPGERPTACPVQIHRVSPRNLPVDTIFCRRHSPPDTESKRAQPPRIMKAVAKSRPSTSW